MNDFKVTADEVALAWAVCWRWVLWGILGYMVGAVLVAGFAGALFGVLDRMDLISTATALGYVAGSVAFILYGGAQAVRGGLKAVGRG